MKRSTLLILIPLLVISCNGKVDTPKEEVKVKSKSKVSLEHFFEFLEEESGGVYSVSLRGDEILIDDDFRIKVAIDVENNGLTEGKWVFAANFKTEIITGKGETRIMNYGSVGLGEGPEEAFEVAVSEWIGGYGTSLSRMMFKGEKGTEFKDFTAHSGLLGIRGNGDWLRDAESVDLQIIENLYPALEGDTHKIQWVDLKLLLGENGLEDGECRINNELKLEALEELKNLDWPKLESACMYKQFFVITNGPFSLTPPE